MAACSGASQQLVTTSEQEYGVSFHVEAGDQRPILVGTSAVCAENGPVVVDALSWREGEGVEIEDFAVDRVALDGDRVGLLRGALDTELEAPGNRVVRAQCRPGGGVGGPTVDMLVLQLTPPGGSVVRSARGLLVDYTDADGRKGTLVEPLAVSLCPPPVSTCG